MPSEQGRLWAARRRVQEMITEADAEDDVDLWAEIDVKLTDVMCLWRRAKRRVKVAAPVPTGEELADQMLIEAFHLPCSPDADLLADAVEAESMNRTRHILVTESGLLWIFSLKPLATLLDGLACGWINIPAWPDGLGEEPAWFVDEVETLRGWWDEERRIEAEEGAAEMSRMESEYWAGCVTR